MKKLLLAAYFVVALGVFGTIVPNSPLAPQPAAAACVLPYPTSPPLGTQANPAPIWSNLTTVAGCANNGPFNASSIVPTSSAQATFGGGYPYIFPNGATFGSPITFPVGTISGALGQRTLYDFGAVAGYDATAAFTAAMAYLNAGTGRSVIIPPNFAGWIYHQATGGPLTLTGPGGQGSGFVGVGQTSIINCIDSTGACLNIGASNANLNDLTLEANNLTSGAPLVIANGGGIVLDRLTVISAANGIQVTTGSSWGAPWFTNLVVNTNSASSVAIDLTGMSASFARFYGIAIVGHSSSDTASIGIHLPQTVAQDTVDIQACDIAHYGTAILDNPTSGGSSTDVTIRDCPNISGNVNALMLNGVGPVNYFTSSDNYYDVQSGQAVVTVDGNGSSFHSSDDKVFYGTESVYFPSTSTWQDIQLANIVLYSASGNCLDVVGDIGLRVNGGAAYGCGAGLHLGSSSSWTHNRFKTFIGFDASAPTNTVPFAFDSALSGYGLFTYFANDMDITPFANEPNQPAVPSSGSAASNPYPTDQTVCVYPSGATGVTVMPNDRHGVQMFPTAPGLVSGGNSCIPVPFAGSLSITYTGGPPIWQWMSR